MSEKIDNPIFYCCDSVVSCFIFEITSFKILFEIKRQKPSFIKRLFAFVLKFHFRF